MSEALRAIRYARSLKDSPLLDLHLVSLRLRAEGVADTSTARSWALGHILQEIVDERLIALRADSNGNEESREGEMVTGAEAELVRLSIDLRSGAAARRALGLLHARFLSEHQLSVRMLADRLGLSQRTVRNWVSRGVQLLATTLGEKEHAALARRAEDQAPAGRRASVPHNFPALATRFIGREREMATLREHLAASAWVTMAGPGGIGKSRLAMALAKSLARDFAHGAWWVELAAITDASDVPRAMATVLDLRPGGSLSIDEIVIEALAESHMLLVLDNCEHLAPDVSAFVSRLRRSCPRLQLLVTSRRPLGGEAETVWRVPPMSLPTSQAEPAAARTVHFDALRLFVARAWRSASALELEALDIAVVHDVCLQLEGLPLAIELAAAHVSRLGLDGLRNALGPELRWPAGDPNPQPLRPQHATMQAAIAWSVDLLGPAASALLVRLAVFRAGWTMGGAEAVGAGEGLPATRIPEALDALATHSMIERRVGAAGERWQMLEPVRQVALALPQGSVERRAADDRLLDHLLASAEDASDAIRGSRQARGLAQLADEEENVWATLDTAGTAARVERGLRVATAMQPYLYVRGRYREGCDRIEALLSSPAADHATANTLAAARSVAGGMAALAGDADRAEPLLRSALAHHRSTGDPRGEADSLHHLATVAFRRSELGRAVDHLRGAVRLRRACGAPELADSLSNLGVMLKGRLELEEAESCFSEALGLARARQDRHAVSDLLSNMGNLALDLQDFGGSRARHEESLAIKRDLGDRAGIGRQLLNLGGVLQSAGDPVVAAGRFTESLAIWREIDDRAGIALCLGALGECHLDAGDPERAVPFLREHLQRMQQVGSPGQMLDGLAKWSRLEDARGHTEQALRIVAATGRIREKREVPASPSVSREAERIADSAHATLGSENAARIAAEAARMDLARVIAYALG